MACCTDALFAVGGHDEAGCGIVEDDGSVSFIGDEAGAVAEDASVLALGIYDLTVLTLSDGEDTADPAGVTWSRWSPGRRSTSSWRSGDFGGNSDAVTAEVAVPQRRVRWRTKR